MDGWASVPKTASGFPSWSGCHVRMAADGYQDGGGENIEKQVGEDVRNEGHTSAAHLYHTKTANHHTAPDKLLQHNYFLSQKCPRLSMKLLLLEALSVFPAKLADFGKGEIISIPATGVRWGSRCGRFRKCGRQQRASSCRERQPPNWEKFPHRVQIKRSEEDEAVKSKGWMPNKYV